MPTLAISAEDVGFLIVKAREFDVKEANSDPDSGSNATDDNMIDVLEDNSSDPVASEIAGFINALSEEEQIDLVALMRLGAATAPSKSGTISGARRPMSVSATGTPPATFSDSRCWATTWRMDWLRSG